MTTYRIDRCAVTWCRTTLMLDDGEACPGGHVLVCERCSWVDACDECEVAAA